MAKSISNIVCGYEPSSGGNRAATAAASLARSLCCRTRLVHVTHDAPSASRAGLSSLGEDRRRQEIRSMAEQWGFPAQTTVQLAAGDPAEQLVRVAEEEDAELIIVGSRGLRELGSALLGSVSSALMREAPCPVVVVPPDLTAPLAPEPMGSIVCGVEGSERDGRLLRLSADLARRLMASLHAVHAFDPRPPSTGVAAVAPPVLPELREAAEATLSGALADSGVRAHGQIISLRPASALKRVAVEEAAGLIVVASQGRGKLGSILHGSVTVQLAAMSPVPVLVLPPSAELTAGSGHYELPATRLEVC